MEGEQEEESYAVELVLDTRNALPAANGSAVRYWNLSSAVRLRKVAFKQCILPMTFKNITSQSSVSVTVTRVSSAGLAFLVIIPPGLWTVSSLIEFINSNISRSLNAAAVNNTTIAIGVAPHERRWYFGWNTYVDSTKPVDPFFAGFEVDVSGAELQELLGETYLKWAESPKQSFAIQLSNNYIIRPSAIDLCTSSLSLRNGSIQLAGQQRFILHRLPISTMVDNGSITPASQTLNYISPDTTYFEHDEQQPLRMLGFYWADEAGNIIDFNGADWSISILCEAV